MTQRWPLLELRGATVRYGTEVALDNVDFRMLPGEVHSLMGENGAGKSTLIRAITGALPLAQGELILEGKQVRFNSPHEAQQAGISTVYQEIDLLPNLSVEENITLGREPRRWGIIDRKQVRKRASQVLAELGLELNPKALLGHQSVAVQQLVAIARAIAVDCKVLVLDEPTSSLDLDEVGELFRVIRELKDRGVAILFVSHFLDQVYEICDRITVLRDGAFVGEYPTKELLRIDLVQKMLGKEVGELRERTHQSREQSTEAPYLVGAGLSNRAAITDVDIEIFEGEVLGVAGLLGSGRTELARVLTGVDKTKTGEVLIQDGQRAWDSPREAIADGLVYSSENRRTEGIVGELSVLDNISLAVQAERGVFRRIKPEMQRELAASWIEALDIRPPDMNRRAGTLSGGNQQKLLLARLLALSPRVLVLDEPTRGVDLGAKVEIQNLVSELADNGLSVVFISAELEEVVRLGDRVAVLRDGKLVATIAADDATVDAVLALVARPTDVEDE